MTNCAYLGASQQCAEEIFASTVIEAVVAYPDDPAWLGMDNLNRPDAHRASNAESGRSSAASGHRQRRRAT
jgi:hypothetical protein